MISTAKYLMVGSVKDLEEYHTKRMLLYDLEAVVLEDEYNAGIAELDEQRSRDTAQYNLTRHQLGQYERLHSNND